MAWADRHVMEATERAEGLRRLSEVSTSAGTVAVAEVPAATIERHGLVPGTRVGALIGDAHVSHQFFLRPLHRLADVLEHYDQLQLQDAPGGMRTGDRRIALVTQQFRCDLPEGMLTISPPEGTPAGSFRSTRAGKMWLDVAASGRRSVVLETRSVRLAVRPIGATSTGAAAAERDLAGAEERLGEVRGAEWSR